jgi:hypothetical protein
MKAGFWVARPKEDDPVRPDALAGPDDPDVARERVLLQVEQELLQGAGSASRGPDELSFWEKKVLRRGTSSE